MMQKKMMIALLFGSSMEKIKKASSPTPPLIDISGADGDHSYDDASMEQPTGSQNYWR